MKIEQAPVVGRMWNVCRHSRSAVVSYRHTAAPDITYTTFSHTAEHLDTAKLAQQLWDRKQENKTGFPLCGVELKPTQGSGLGPTISDVLKFVLIRFSRERHVLIAIWQLSTS